MDRRERRKEQKHRRYMEALMAQQDNPVVVAQIIAYQALRESPEWPPESASHLKQIGQSLSSFVTNFSVPSVEVEYGEDDEE